MKPFPLLVILFWANPLLGQTFPKITTTIDEFDGDTLIQSEWVKLNEAVWKSGSLAYVRLSKSDTFTILELRVTTGKEVVSVDKGDEWQIKLNNNEVLTLQNLDYTISEKGGGSIGLSGSDGWGFRLMFLLSKENLDKLAQNRISKFRLSTSKGFLEVEPEKDKYRENVQMLASVFQNYTKNK